MPEPTAPDTSLPPDLFGPGHNNPPEPLPYDPVAFADLKATTAQFVNVSDMWLKVEINTESLAGQMTDQITGLRALLKNIETARTKAKEPWLAKGKEVDKAFGALTDLVEKSISALNPIQLAYVQKREAEERARQEAARRAAQAQAEEARRMALDAENSRSIAAKAEAEEAAKRAADAMKAADRPITTAVKSASGAGRTMSTRTRREVAIEKIGMTFMHYRENPKVREVLTALANSEANSADFKDGDQIPGCTITKKTTIA